MMQLAFLPQQQLLRISGKIAERSCVHEPLASTWWLVVRFLFHLGVSNHWGTLRFPVGNHHFGWRWAPQCGAIQFPVTPVVADLGNRASPRVAEPAMVFRGASRFSRCADIIMALLGGRKREAFPIPRKMIMFPKNN